MAFPSERETEEALGRGANPKPAWFYPLKGECFRRGWWVAKYAPGKVNISHSLIKVKINMFFFTPSERVSITFL